MPLIRKQLKPSDVYPENIRYDMDTDTVQSNINGEWVDNPAADPRKQTVFPPRITDDTRCDAAASISDAFHNQINGIITAIDNGSTAFTIAGLILSVFSFGVFAVFISFALFIADQMIAAGSAALEASLNETAWEKFTCILYCNMNNSGRLNAGSQPLINSQIDTEIGGLGAEILKGMVKLAGEGGMNNLAAIGESEGNCSDCDCGECETTYETDNLGGGDNRGEFLGVFEGYLRYRSTNGGTSTQAIFLNSLDQFAGCELIDFRVTENPENLAATYLIPVGNAQTGGNLVSNWSLGICANFLAAQTPTGSNIPFTIEFLFAQC